MYSSPTLTTNSNSLQGKKNSTPSIFLLSPETSESLNDLDEFVDILHEKLQIILTNFKPKSVFLEKNSRDNLKRIIAISRLNQKNENNLNLYASKMHNASIQLSRKTFETNRILEDFLLNIDPKNNIDSLNLAESIDVRNSHSNHIKSNNFIENIILIENLIHKQMDSIKSNDVLYKDNELSKEFNQFLDKLNSFINEEKRKFICDLCSITFDYIRIAKLILESENNQQIFNQEDNSNTCIKSPKNLRFIKFSSDQVLTEPIVNEFNKNIISLRLTRLFESQPGQKINKSQASKCIKCSAYLSYFIQVNDSKWTCNLCGEENTNALTQINHYDVEYLEVNDIVKKNYKIIVFCIDISNSMSGKRLDMIRNTCIKNLLNLKQDNPDYKVALVTFSSVAIYHGHGNLNERINLTQEDWCSKSNIERIKQLANDLLPIKESYSKLETRLNSVITSRGTNIVAALAQSVIIASTIEHSEVILCTDGITHDKNEQFYDLISKYCTTNSTKINLVSFEDTECDLHLLSRLVLNTKRKLSQSLDEFKFEQFYNEIIEESLKTNSQSKLNIVLLADYYLIGLNRQNEYKLELNNVDQNEREILIEFMLLKENLDKNYVYFQLQINSINSTRVITSRLKLKNATSDNNCKIINSELIHAYSLKRLLNISIDEKDLKRAKNYLSEYSKFNKQQNNDILTDKVQNTIELVENLANNQSLTNEKDDLKLNPIISFDLKRRKTGSRLIKLTESIQLNNKEISKLIDENEKEFLINLDDDRLVSDYVEYKSKLLSLLDTFNLNDKFIKIKNDKSVKKLYVVNELLEYSLNTIKTLKHPRKESFKQRSLISHHNSIIPQMNFVDELLNELTDIKLLYENFIHLDAKITNTPTSTKVNNDINWEFTNESYSEALFQELNEFILNPINDTNFNIIRCLNSISSQLIQKSRQCAFNAQSVSLDASKSKNTEFRFIIENSQDSIDD